MTVAKVGWQIVAFACAAMCCPTGGAETVETSVDLRRQSAIQGDASVGATKATLCGACHGPQGMSLIADFPSLAGQSATYLYLQLRAYRVGTRPSDVMRPLVESLSDQDMKDLSAYYASLTAQRSATAATGDTDVGRTLYERGNSAAGIPPCQGCHGVAATVTVVPARGARPGVAWATYPSLAGQQHQYIATQLAAYRSGARGGTTNTRIMHAVVQNLDDSSMQHVAEYLSQLPKN